jgi:hypothetical protein
VPVIAPSEYGGRHSRIVEKDARELREAEVAGHVT